MGMRAILLALLVTGCLGDDIVPPSPTGPTPSGPGVAPVQPGGSPPPAAACSYTEHEDGTNDYRARSGYVIEETGVVYSGQAQTICGNINNGHFDTNDWSIDIDNYGITLAQDADVLVTLTGKAELISSVGVWAYDPRTGQVPGGGYFIYDHGVFSAHLTAGHYEFSVEAYDDADIAAPVPYTLQIAADQPTVRCGALARPADYMEAGDGTANNGNDVFDVDFDANPTRMFTAANTDRPEDMELPLMSGSSLRIDGEAAMEAPVGSYLDHDTYLVTTGPTTNQLAIRLDWAGNTADLDYYLSTAGSTYPIASATTQQLGGGEFATFAVVPNTRYWLWIGSYLSSTTSANYDATLCAETFSGQ